MFYKIAIIQNEKEVFKYDCADWNNLFKDNPAFSFYKLKYFDEHNITDLLDTLKEYDAAFFATNAFNSTIIYEACKEHLSDIGYFIESGKGLFIGYSSKNKAHEFLPEKYRIEQKERLFDENDSEMDGLLEFFPHPLTQAHKTVSLTQYENTAKHHTTIAGLYFDYLLFEEKHNSVYDKIVIDKKYKNDRSLLVSTKIATGARLVITTLPIDWQKQIDFFINIVKFCTEGEPIIKIISKDGVASNDFSREYLSRQLNLYKRPFLFETLSSLNEVSLDGCKFETIIFDCAWKDKEVDQFCEQNLTEIYNKNIRVLHYYNYKSSRDPIYKLTVHSAFQQVDLIEEGLLIAIQERTPNEKNKYSYDSSLLTTYESIKLLQQNNIKNEDLYNKIICTGKKRLLADGSYDAMFVASANFYAVWTLCDMNAKADEKYLLLQNYIKKGLLGNGTSSVSAYEKAQVLYFLKDTDVLSLDEQRELVLSLIAPLSLANREDIFSYGISNCWSVFSDNISILQDNQLSRKDLSALVKNLLSLLGDMKNDSKIVILSNYILTLSNIIKYNVVTDTGDLRILYKLLFASIGQIYDRKDGVLWNDDIYSSCFAIKALKRFSELSTYPIDEILTLSQPNSLIFSFEGDSSRFDYSMILESTNQQTNELISIRLELEEEKENSLEKTKKINQLESDLKEKQKVVLEKEELIQKTKEELQNVKANYKTKKALDVIGRLSIVGLVFFIVQLIFVAINHKDAFLNYFSSFNSFLSWSLVGISTIITLVTFIRFFRRKKPL